MGKVRIGVIGIGGRGSAHAKYFLADDIPHGEVTAVCDVDPDRIQWARDNMGENVRTFDSGDDLIKSGAVDAIIVATPHYDHPTYAIKGFEQGLHVLRVCEEITVANIWKIKYLSGLGQPGLR